MPSFSHIVTMLFEPEFYLVGALGKENRASSGVTIALPAILKFQFALSAI